MKIECLDNTMASGNQLEKGKSYEVSERDGLLLVRLGKAKKLADGAKAAPAQVPTVSVKALDNTVASGQQLLVGETYKISENDARILVSMKKVLRTADADVAEPAGEEAGEAEASESDESAEEEVQSGRRGRRGR